MFLFSISGSGTIGVSPQRAITDDKYGSGRFSDISVLPLMLLTYAALCGLPIKYLVPSMTMYFLVTTLTLAGVSSSSKINSSNALNLQF